MPATPTARTKPRDAVHAILDQVDALFAAFGAPQPKLRDTGVIATETPRLVGPIPRLDVTSLSVTVAS